MAFLNSATAPGRSDFPERATPSQLWASADRGSTSTALRNSWSARGYSLRPQYARPSATRALALVGARRTAASSWLTDGGAASAFGSWAAALAARTSSARAETPRIGQRFIPRDRAGEAAAATWRRPPREATSPARAA